MSEPVSNVEAVPRCNHCGFGLIVTGQGERQFLPDLFSVLTKFSGCSFKVIRKIDQRGPVTNRLRLKMVGSGSAILDKDEQEIGLAARAFLRNHDCHFVIVIDDVESNRRECIAEIWQRYRTAIDTMLLADERKRAAVHFLANMLEAYYFADCNAVNTALGAMVLPRDHVGDVEEIPHPKHALEKAASAAGTSFKERRDGGKIVQALDLERVLQRNDACAYLRSLFEWCVTRLLPNCPVWDPAIGTAFGIQDGIKADLTRHQ
jgi:hypothetical protein